MTYKEKMDELSRRAKSLTSRECTWKWNTDDGKVQEKELLIEGRTPWTIIITSDIEDVAVYYGTPKPQYLISDRQWALGNTDYFETENLNVVLEALRGMMVLDDLADV